MARPKPHEENYRHFYFILIQSFGLVSFAKAARILRVYRKDKPDQLFGQNTLFRLLKARKIIKKDNTPFQEYMPYFAVKIKYVGKEKDRVVTKTYFNKDGLIRLYNFFVNNNYTFANPYQNEKKAFHDNLQRNI